MDYAGVRGEGSIPVPPLRQPRHGDFFSMKVCGHLGPVTAALSHIRSVLLGGALFSEWPIYLRSFELCGFGTILEIRMFPRASDFNEVGFGSSS